MKDTSNEALKFQRENAAKMTDRERAMQGIEMYEMGRLVVTNSVKKQYPELSGGTLQAKIFERLYLNDFKTDEMEKIKRHIIDSHTAYE